MKIMVEKPTPEKLQTLKVTGWPIWECDPSTFDWSYSDQEVCYILEGKVKVKTPTEEVSFGKGDLVTFPKGLTCAWTVIEKVRKHYRFG